MGDVTWHTDDSPPRLWTRAYVARMWAHRDKQAFEGAEHTRDVAESKQREGDHPPTRLTRALTRVRESEVQGMRTWTVRPRRGTPVARVLYLHGGGYVHPLTPDYWRLVRALVRAPAEVVVPGYPLAPGATIDDVVPRLVDLAASLDDLPLVVMGDSAGGALTLVVGQALRDRGADVRPRRLALLSPWLDATLDEPGVEELEVTDPMLAESGLRAAGRWWAGPREPSDPLVSPLEGDLSGLPRADLFVGDHDILRPAVETLAERARRTPDARLTVHERTAMFHVWMTRQVPEAARTRRDLRRLVARAGDEPDAG